MTIKTVAAQNAIRPKQAIKKVPFALESGVHTQSHLKMLVYGEAGVGKTQLVGSSLEVNEMCDVLLINADAGDLTLTTNPQLKNKLNNLATIRVTNWVQFARVYDFLKAHCLYQQEGNEEKLKELQETYIGTNDSGKLFKFKTVIIDSISEVEAFSMAMAIGVAVNGKLDEELPETNWEEIRQNRSNIMRCARQFRDLPLNVLLTAGRTVREDEAKRTNFMPDLTGSLREKLPHYVDVVGYFVAGTKTEGSDKVIVRRLHVQPVGKWIAKCRFASFKGNYFDDPTLPSIMREVGLL